MASRGKNGSVLINFLQMHIFTTSDYKYAPVNYKSAFSLKFMQRADEDTTAHQTQYSAHASSTSSSNS